MHTPGVPENEPSKKDRGFRDVRHYVPHDILDVSFPVGVRGYDRGAVDAYVKRVNRVIAELKVSASPPAAVRHALDQAQEKVESLLQAAREAADEITTSARREADENIGRAKTEAADLMVNTSAEAGRLKTEADEVLAKARAEAEAVVAKAKSDANAIVTEANTQAEDTRARVHAESEERRRQLQDELTKLEQEARARMDQIQADTDAVWSRRGDLLDDVRQLGSRLAELAGAADARLPEQHPAPDEATEALPLAELSSRNRDERGEATETTTSGSEAR